MMSLIFTGFLNNMGTFSIGSWEVPTLGLILFLVITAVLLFVNLLVKNVIKEKRNSSRKVENIYSSVYFFQRLILAIIIIILAVNLLNISSDYVTIVSSIIITAVMFASVKALNNFVAGIYITLTRPFVVGDFINVGGVEGLVLEITLNYTIIRHKDASVTSIPNLVCLKSNIINFTLSIEAFQERIKKLEINILIKNVHLVKDMNPKLRLTIKRMNDELKDMQKTLDEIHVFQKKYLKKQKEQKMTRKDQKDREEIDNKEIKKLIGIVKDWTDEEEVDNGISEKKKANTEIKQKFVEIQEQSNIGKVKSQNHSEYVDEDKIIRYTFVQSLEKTHIWNSKCLDEVCERWKDEFEVTPSWCVTGIGGRINYQFTIITPDPYDIIHFYDAFVKDIYTTVYNK